MQPLEHRRPILRSSRAHHRLVSHRHHLLNAACCETLEPRRLLAADVPNDYVKLNSSPIIIGTESAAPVSTGITLDAGENFYFVASGSHQLATNPTRYADAQYYQRDDISWAKGGKPHLRVNGVGYWGAFDSSHVYGAAAVGNGAELTPWVNDSYYADNAGTLSLDVYQTNLQFSFTAVWDASAPKWGQATLDVTVNAVLREFGGGTLSLNASGQYDLGDREFDYRAGIEWLLEW